MNHPLRPALHNNQHRIDHSGLMCNLLYMNMTPANLSHLPATKEVNIRPEIYILSGHLWKLKSKEYFRQLGEVKKGSK